MHSYKESRIVETSEHKWFQFGYSSFAELNSVWGTRKIKDPEDPNEYIYITTILEKSGCGCRRDERAITDDFYEWSAESAVKTSIFNTCIGDDHEGILHLWFTPTDTGLLPIITVLYYDKELEASEPQTTPFYHFLGAEMLRTFETWAHDPACSDADIQRHASQCLESWMLSQNIMCKRQIMKEFKKALENDDEAKINTISTNESFARWTLKVDSIDDAPVLVGLPKILGIFDNPDSEWVAPNSIGVAAATLSNYSVSAMENLRSLGADLNAVSYRGIAPVHLAARQMNHKALAYLAKSGANLEVKSGTGSKSALHYASWAAALTGNTDCMEILLSAGVDVNTVTEAGDTPLHFVQYGAKPRALEILLEHPHIDVNAKNGWGETAWDMFKRLESKYVAEGRTERVEILDTFRKYGIPENQDG